MEKKTKSQEPNEENPYTIQGKSSSAIRNDLKSKVGMFMIDSKKRD